MKKYVIIYKKIPEYNFINDFQIKYLDGYEEENVDGDWVFRTDFEGTFYREDTSDYLVTAYNRACQRVYNAQRRVCKQFRYFPDDLDEETLRKIYIE